MEKLFSTSLWIQTWHRPLLMIVVHYRWFNPCRDLPNERFMKLGLATKFSSASRKTNSLAQELHTMIYKTWCSSPGSLIAESIISGTIHKACVRMTCLQNTIFIKMRQFHNLKFQCVLNLIRITLIILRRFIYNFHCIIFRCATHV